jgi:hypothetical protein
MNERRQRPLRATQTTLGELVAACYEAALAEVRDEATARRITAVLVEDVLNRVAR